ncbi:uncharacterized protein A4U43_C05F5600 [Asparagus officinalis]|uniref:Uncharacterized protein n=1 Tax=Asparagus officinalis TaxID=4686 RepID=A0A5P1EPV3_ASPOF|nr:uncharacterized protein A4U43_C05F5600 [Asparagus officinalis]
MLQWMGGSRRKVTSSRKSIHNRQRQYFEQRKRQQHVTGVENQSDAQNQDHYSEEPCSLDILSLINLATSSQQGYRSETREHDGSQDSQFTQLPLENMSRKATSGLPEDLDKSHKPVYCHSAQTVQTDPNRGLLSSLSNLVPSVPTSYGSSSRSDKRKLQSLAGERTSNFINKLSKQEEVHDVNEQFSEVSVLDLLDDGPTSNSGRGPVPEGYVAFSVEGLGQVGIGTPAHSPRRNLPSPPKAPRRMQPSAKHKSYQYNLGITNDDYVNLANSYACRVKLLPARSMILRPNCKLNIFQFGC